MFYGFSGSTVGFKIYKQTLGKNRVTVLFTLLHQKILCQAAAFPGLRAPGQTEQ